ncbi:MAG: divalent-cation tolerance protein CutA [Gemmatimonadota bacterium]|nr:divalent-cation tolerance protein CutA [Gemmatimonadota bacterium]
MTHDASGPRARVALVSGPDRETMLEIARTLVEERLIACANLIVGARSVYRWEGRVEEADECLGVFKTTAGRIDEIETRLRELHPYDVPELVVLEVVGGSAPYLAWLGDCTVV